MAGWLLKNAAIALVLLCASQAFAVTLSGPSTSTGTHTLNWSGSAQTLHETQNAPINAPGASFYANHNAQNLSALTVSGRPLGTYYYQAMYYTGGQWCDPWLGCNPNFDFSNAVAVTVLVASPALSTPASSTTGSYTVSWSAVGSATSYQLDRSSDGVNWANIVNGNTTSVAQSGLPNGTYHYRVRACGSNGCGAYGATASTTVLLIPVAPGTPVAPVNNSSGVYTVSWAAVATATSYQLDRSADGLNWTNIVNGNTTSRAESGMASGNYRYRVRACNASGCSGYSGIAATVVLLVPATPVISTPANSATGSFTVSWTASAGANKYQLDRSADGVNWTANVVDANVLQLAQNGFANGSYRYRARACNASGCSANSAVATTTVLLPPQAVTLTAPVHSSNGSFALSWSAAATATGYQLQQRTGAAAWADIYSGANTTFSTSTLSPAAYQYQVRACNAGGCGPYSMVSLVHVGIAPVVPGAITAPAGNSSGAYAVAWGAAAGSTGYELQERIDGGSWDDRYAGAELSVNFSGKVPATYGYRVRACNPDGCSAYTAVADVVVAVPAVPAGLAVPATVTGNEFTVTWNANPLAASFELQERLEGNAWTTFTTAGNTMTLAGRLPRKRFDYRVRACSVLGCSAYSAEVSTTIAAGGNPLVSLTPAGMPIIAQAQIDASEAVGALPGRFTVNKTGAATYSIPITLAKGSGGSTPALALEYSSQGPNGLLGQGWSIAGLSEINRCRATREQDGNSRTITWTGEDRFCLDGQRLVLVSGGAYGAVGSVYRTEIDSYVRVTALGGSAGNPAYFKLEGKGGEVAFYGDAPLSRSATATNLDGAGDAKQLGAGGAVLTWAVKKRQDGAGNPIWFLYGNDADGFNIQGIHYAYGSGAGPAASSARLDFVYEGRADERYQYVGGHQLSFKRRLKEVQYYESSTLVHQYKLTYTDAPTAAYSGPSRLTSIEQCRGSICMPATTFEWAANPTGFSSAPSGSHSGIPALTPYQFLDVNGDGCQELAWTTLSGNGLVRSLHYSMGTCVGGSSPSISFTQGLFSNGQATIELPPRAMAKLVVTDYNRDGRMDIIVSNSATGYYNYDESAHVYLAVPMPDGQWRLSADPITLVPPGSVRYSQDASDETPFHGVDLNGDGLLDWMYRYSWTDLMVRYGEVDTVQPAGSSKPYRTGAAQTLTTLGCLPAGSTKLRETPVGDLNGDGKPDFLSSSEIGQSGYAVAQGMAPGSGVECLSAVLTDVSSDYRMFADLNNDGLVDMYYMERASGRWYYRLSTGNGFTERVCVPPVAGGSCDPFTQHEHRLVDYNHDGYPDLVWYDGLQQQRKIRLWDPKTGNFGPEFNGGYGPATLHWETDVYADLNGDGISDFIFAPLGKPESFYLGNGVDQPRNVIVKVTDGVGAETAITYGNLTKSSHYQQLQIGGSTQTFQWNGRSYTFTTAEQADFYTTLRSRGERPAGAHGLAGSAVPAPLTGPFYAVVRVEKSAPQTMVAGLDAVDPAAKSAQSYYYGAGFVEASVRGFLGFHTIQIVDEQSGIRSTTAYRQDFPFTGQPLRTEVTTSAGKKIKTATHTWSFQNWGAGHASAPYRPVLVEKDERVFDPIATANGQTSRVRTTISYDQYGNMLTSTEETYDAAGALVDRQQTSNVYGATAEEGWLGLASRTDQLYERPGQPTITRRKDFRYFCFGGVSCAEASHRGLLYQEIVEPAKSAYTLTSTHNYDALGNRSSTTLVATGETSRTTHWAYDARGRFLNKVTDAKGHVVEQVMARDVFGQPTTINGLNGKVSQLRYGALGRRYLQYTNDGAYTYSLRYTALSGCPVGTAFAETTVNAGGAQRSTCFDRLQRPVREIHQAFDNAVVHTDTQYDNLGRVRHTTEPYSAGTALGSVYFTTHSYDVLGRTTAIKHPDGTTTALAYSGLDVTTTNAKSQTRTEKRNALNELVEVMDPLGGKILYSYYSDGNLRTTQTTGSDQANGVPAVLTTSMSYDELGRKTGVVDLNKGSVSYAYNRFGEVVLQTDAKGQTSTVTYDVLGRMVGRVDRRADTSIETDTSWVYDTAANGLGQLDYVQENVGGYIRAVEYDSLGRVAKTGYSFSANDSYFERASYDQYGRVYQRFDAAGPVSGTQNVYRANGYLEKIIDPLNVATVYYQVNAMNARGQVTGETHGAVSTVMAYTPALGRLESITSSAGLNTGLQHLSYAYDSLGNLTSRRDRSGGKDITETFDLDDLNRVTSSQVGGAAAVATTYDSFGNIKTRSGAGTYGYGSGSNGAGPHAVISITGAGAATYTYDGNGNNIGGGGRTLSYTTFDRPQQIDQGGHTTAFDYDPDRNYYRRVDAAGGQTTTTLYIGNVERVAKADGSVELRRYLPGAGLVSTSYSAAGVQQSSSTRYLLKDHLGSLDVIVDQTGTVVQAMSFDAWGLRRNAGTWTPLTPTQLAGFDHSRTGLGYTGHEMLDELGLIHMGGRIYDPRLGRMMQADPLVPFVTSTQSYNRYAYVRNNPLVATDPSGFIEEIVVIGKGSTPAADNFPLTGSYFGSIFSNVTIDFGGFASTGTIPSGDAGAIASPEARAPGTKQYNETLRESAEMEEIEVLAEAIGQPDDDKDRLRKEMIAGAISLLPLSELGQCLFGGCSAQGWGLAAISAFPPVKLVKIAAKTAVLASRAAKRGAESAKQAANLKEHLRQTAKYGKGGVKDLQSGRTRYYGETVPANKTGEMAGRRTVREWDPATGNKRTWHETVDHSGKVRQVRPEFDNGNKIHYTFDKGGNYTGSW